MLSVLRTDKIVTIVFHTVEDALEQMALKGGWFFWDYNADVCFWFDFCQFTQDTILSGPYIKGRDGYLGSHDEMLNHHQEKDR